MIKSCIHIMVFGLWAGGIMVGISLSVSGCAGGGGGVRFDVWRELFEPDSILREIAPDDKMDGERKLYAVEGAEGISGYIVEDTVVSRSGPFRIMVITDQAGRVKEALVLKYRYTHGRKVMAKRFTSQFAGKGPGDPIRLDEDIDAISGATISSGAMTEGVRQAVELIGRLTD